MRDLPAELAKHSHWYHTIKLPGGLTTPGLYDMPPAASRIGMPESLRGRRCLDVGTADGFWAFEMERRGASEVVAMDLGGTASLDWPPAASPVPQEAMPSVARFNLAHEALGSRVQWVAGSVYDLTPATLGSFDFAFIGSMLLHLRDPVQALAAVRTVVRGELLVNEAVSLPLTLLRPWWPAARLVGAVQPAWWVPNVAGLRRFVETAGFQVVAAGGPYLLTYGRGRDTGSERPLTPVALRPLHRLPLQLILNGRDRFGIPHAWVLAAPRLDLPSEPTARRPSLDLAESAVRERELEKERNAYRDELAVLKRSSSWRITAPLRSLMARRRRDANTRS